MGSLGLPPLYRVVSRHAHHHTPTTTPTPGNFEDFKCSEMCSGVFCILQVWLVYRGTRKVNQGTGPGRPRCRNATALCCDTLSSIIFYERQGSELCMVKKEEGKERQQLTGPEPATSRFIADPLAAEPWLLPATINPLPLKYWRGCAPSRASFETPTLADDNHQICITYS